MFRQNIESMVANYTHTIVKKKKKKDSFPSMGEVGRWEEKEEKKGKMKKKKTNSSCLGELPSR